jgi:hypothetical protein
MFGPAGEVPLLSLESVKPVGSSLNLQPPSVFSEPAKLLIPCEGYSDVSSLNVYLYNGTEWVLAYDKKGVQPGGYGWAVPDSRKNHNKGNPSTIEIKVYHLSGAQAGALITPLTPPSSGSEKAESSCFIDIVER